MDNTLTWSHGRQSRLAALVEECVPEGQEGVARPDGRPDQLHLGLVEQPRLPTLSVDVRVRPEVGLGQFQFIKADFTCGAKRNASQ